jgi:hypothetical protein
MNQDENSYFLINKKAIAYPLRGEKQSLFCLLKNMNFHLDSWLSPKYVLSLHHE